MDTNEYSVTVGDKNIRVSVYGPAPDKDDLQRRLVLRFRNAAVLVKRLASPHFAHLAKGFHETAKDYKVGVTSRTESY